MKRKLDSDTTTHAQLAAGMIVKANASDVKRSLTELHEVMNS